MAEYNARRDRCPKRPTAIGTWAPGARPRDSRRKPPHLATVVRLNPARDAAWKRLGCRRVGGRWVTEEQLAAERKEAEAQKQANKHWQPLLTKWRGWLRKEDRRAEAEHALAEITDPLAVPAVWAVFAGEGTKDQLLAVQVFGQIDASASARTLALLVARTKSSAVRQAACETLRRRDPREYVGFFLALLRDPLGYRTGLFFGEDGLLHRSLFVQGKQGDTLATFEGPVTGPGIPYRAVPSMRLFTGDVPYDPLYAQYSMMFNGPFLNQATTETLRAMVDNPRMPPRYWLNPVGPAAREVKEESYPAPPRLQTSSSETPPPPPKLATSGFTPRQVFLGTACRSRKRSANWNAPGSPKPRPRVRDQLDDLRRFEHDYRPDLARGPRALEEVVVRRPGLQLHTPKETKKDKPVRLLLSIPSCFSARDVGEGARWMAPGRSKRSASATRSLPRTPRTVRWPLRGHGHPP